MKKTILSILALIYVTVVSAQTINNHQSSANNPPSRNAVDQVNSKNGIPHGTFVINQNDSIFFDVEQATSNGITIEFPVSMRSDDVINALDFAIKYDQTFLQYDTIINLASYIEPLSYYNPTDSTIRLTSYSFTQPYTNDTPLFIVRFTLLAGHPGYLCTSDIDSVSAMLNGDASAFLVTDCHVGLNDEPSDVPFNLYPNPSTEFINIEVPDMQSIEIFDIHSRLVYDSKTDIPVQKSIIDISNFQSGSYLAKVSGKNFVSFKQFVVSK